MLEAETSSHLHNKPLKIVQNSRLQFGLRIGIMRLHAKELQRNRVMQYFLWTNLLGILGNKPLKVRLTTAIFQRERCCHQILRLATAKSHLARS